MKLLVITQKVDKEDPILGFFHGWLAKLADKFEKVSVICLGKGAYTLPQNVSVFSLGKEQGQNRIKYLLNFYYYIWKIRKDYDAVFVHMNQEYVILGWKSWFLMGKKIYLWRNHPEGSLLTRLAVFLSGKVFYTSEHSFTAKFKKAVQMPVGIDTDKFSILNSQFSNTERQNKILFLGRISPIKRPNLFIEALNLLHKRGVEFKADIYGDALPKDRQYLENLKGKVVEYNLENNIKFNKPVPNYQTPEIYNSHAIFVNLTPSGSFDKTILEAAACGALLVVANRSLKDKIDERQITDLQPEAIALRLKSWLDSAEPQIAEANTLYVRECHGLDALVEKLTLEIEK